MEYKASNSENINLSFLEWSSRVLSGTVSRERKKVIGPF